MTERGKAPGFRRKYFPPLACGPRLFVYFERPVQIVPASGPSRVSLSPRPFKIPRATLPTAIQDFDSRRSTPLSANQYDLARVHAFIFFFLLENVCAKDVSTEPRVRSSFARLLPFSFFSVYLRDRIRKQPAFSFFYREFHDSLPRHSTHPFELAYLLRSARWKSR